MLAPWQLPCRQPTSTSGGVCPSSTASSPTWRSAWARRHPERVRALVYMEAIVRPMTWPEWPETARAIFQAMRSPAGEEIVLQKNVFVERILPASVLRGLSNEEMDKYREPFRQAGES